MSRLSSSHGRSQKSVPKNPQPFYFLESREKARMLDTFGYLQCSKRTHFPSNLCWDRFFMIFLDPDDDDLRLPQGEVERPHGSCHGFGATSSQRCPEHCPDGGQSTKSCRAMTAAKSTYGGV